MPLFALKRCVVVLGLTAENMRRWFSFEKWEDRFLIGRLDNHFLRKFMVPEPRRRARGPSGNTLGSSF